ncbi:tRNA (adenosine(37)-N6)-threonylcarbamoyltransferase complex dimerization subunit type 1 TsaB [Rothia sp. P13129]|uniref:tRNA (adenosine(37)-N6)-threonylcarbamoyltransferase complex dimerization subunit type 1 TsaB n=1 Tax=Rothia sp. P13129 TaxID=3402664 RepID=UPI003AC39118
MLVLALDSSATASVALGQWTADGVRLLGQCKTSDTRSHAEVMAPYVQQTLEQAQLTAKDLDAVLVGRGPGPFTGLRAGIMTARVLSFAHHIPCYGLMSLYTIAESAYEHAQEHQNQRFLVATDARRREVYSAEFELTEHGYQLCTEPAVGSASNLKDLPVYGAGAGLYSNVLNAVADFTHVQPEAYGLLHAAWRLGQKNLKTETSALYLRESDAKVPQSMVTAGTA